MTCSRWRRSSRKSSRRRWPESDWQFPPSARRRRCGFFAGAVRLDRVGGVILTRSPEPTTEDLEDLARTLSTVGAARATIELVERWAEIGEPTPVARIAEAKAFVDLRLVDRAWSRLRDLVEVPEPSRDAVIVAVELFLLREWHERARKLVGWAVARDPTDPVFRALQSKAVDPATTIEPPNVDPDDLTVAELVHTAEIHMAHGAFIKARTMLERARRREPAHLRADDLLWALDGEFLVDTPLDELFERATAIVAESADETEQTEFLDKPRASKPGRRTTDPRFSGLFRGAKEAEPEDTDGGSTQSGARSNPFLSLDAVLNEGIGGEDSLSAPFGTPRAPRIGSLPTQPPRPRGSEPTEVSASHAPSRLSTPEITDGGEDTQIARVLHNSPPGRFPRPLDSVDSDSGASIEDGFGAPTRSSIDGEAEDDSVVIHTRRAPDRDGRARLDPLAAAEEEANHENLAKRWRREDNAWAVATQPRVARSPRAEGGRSTVEQRVTTVQVVLLSAIVTALLVIGAVATWFAVSG